jgi:hypothetical protein
MAASALALAAACAFRGRLGLQTRGAFGKDQRMRGLHPD